LAAVLVACGLGLALVACLTGTLSTLIWVETGAALIFACVALVAHRLIAPPSAGRGKRGREGSWRENTALATAVLAAIAAAISAGNSLLSAGSDEPRTGVGSPCQESPGPPPASPVSGSRKS
jgi:hypothetical protein